jgi:hypothetical protein
MPSLLLLVERTIAGFAPCLAAKYTHVRAQNYAIYRFNSSPPATESQKLPSAESIGAARDLPKLLAD